MESADAKIVALILTHNAPQALNRCIDAITAQTRLPSAIVIVDNASTPPTSPSQLTSGGIPVRVVRSDVNLGPAGGWAIALRDFLEHGFTHAWVMDDDIIPEPTCLDELWSVVSEDPLSPFAVPLSIQPDGSVGWWGSWCGFLIGRSIVEKVGLPMEELFWWAEDTEYGHWRIPQAGFPLRHVESARVHHDAIRRGGELPSWKYYYEARNTLYLHWHIMHRLGWLPRKLARLVARAVIRQKRNRIRCLAAIQGSVRRRVRSLGHKVSSRRASGARP